jgi:hypothetical protein
MIARSPRAGDTSTLLLHRDNPDAEARRLDEVAGVLGGRRPALADLERLPWCMVIEESPPYAWRRVPVPRRAAPVHRQRRRRLTALNRDR